MQQVDLVSRADPVSPLPPELAQGCSLFIRVGVVMGDANPWFQVVVTGARYVQTSGPFFLPRAARQTRHHGSKSMVLKQFLVRITLIPMR